MEPELNIVFVEDVPTEAVLVENVLREDGLKFRLQRVDNRDDFLHALEVAKPDVILSDHGLPQFNGLTALSLAHKIYPHVPFLFVTNSLSRGMELEKLTGGVTDFVPKSQLWRLPAAIRLALTDALEQIKGHLLRLMEEYERLNYLLPICANCKKIRDASGAWHMPEEFFAEHAGLKFTHGLCPDCARELMRS